jgi:hypothetical protein
MARFDVIVGNIGTVYSGKSFRIAKSKYLAYVEASDSPVGRASGECVTVLRDGEIEIQHMGKGKED